MTVQDQRPVDLTGIIARVKAILLTPAAEWAKIEIEPATVGGLYTGYILVLAAIGPVCGAIGGLAFGYGAWLVRYRPSVGAALSQAIVHYVLSLVSVFVLALIIDALAPSFDGQKNRIQAFKVATYASTAAWLAGVFALVPGLSILGLAGLYSVYLLYLGLPLLMKSPEAKAPIYTLVTIVAALILYAIAIAITAPMVGLGALASLNSTSPSTVAGTGSSGSIELPNGQQLDVGKMQSAVNQLGNLAKQFQQPQPNSGSSTSTPTAPGTTVTPVSIDALKALLPDSLPGGYKRIETQSGAMLGGVHAEATYESAGKRVVVSVTDLAAAGAFASLATAFGVESDRETATGFEKVGRVDGRLTTQEWDRTTLHGKYGVLLDDRFLLDAEGNAPSFDDLKNAVAAVGPDRVLRLK
jgi:Yip1 domain